MAPRWGLLAMATVAAVGVLACSKKWSASLTLRLSAPPSPECARDAVLGKTPSVSKPATEPFAPFTLELQEDGGRWTVQSELKGEAVLTAQYTRYWPANPDSLRQAIAARFERIQETLTSACSAPPIPGSRPLTIFKRAA